MLRDSDKTAILVDGSPQYGITTCNVPIGEPGFVKGCLDQRKSKILKGLEDATKLLDPGRWPHPEIPSRQMLWILTLVCFQFMGDYWLRHVRPDYTADFAHGIDQGVLSLVQTCVGVNIDTWSDFARERMRLPMRLKGCGLREAADRRHAQFLGALVQSTMPLIDRTDEHNCTIPGRLSIPSINNLFGEGSFDHPFASPWDTLLTMSGPSSNLANGLKHAWSNLKTKFQEVSTPEQAADDSLLLNQDVTRAGFSPDGTVAPSVTNAVTIELESSRSKDLGTRISGSLNRKLYER